MRFKYIAIKYESISKIIYSLLPLNNIIFQISKIVSTTTNTILVDTGHLRKETEWKFEEKVRCLMTEYVHNSWEYIEVCTVSSLTFIQLENL